MSHRSLRLTSAAGAALALAAPVLGLALAAAPAHAATTETVTECDISRQLENTPPAKDWVLYSRNAGTGAFVDGPADPPVGTGSFELITPTSADKATLFNFDHVGAELTDISTISYSTYRSAGSAQQVAAINLQVDVNGAAPGGFTTLVFEPVYNTDQGAVTSDVWQDWDAYNGGNAMWWSSNPIPSAPNRDTFVSWNTIVAANPNAVIVGGVGVNQGSGNPGLISSVDAFTFDGVTYDFERVADSDCDGIPDGEDTNSKEDCKNGGHARFTSPTFSNQGQCVSYFESNSPK